MKHGIFITVEGMDGCGKSTQIEMMKNYLTDRGYEVLLTREPGGTGISEKIRAILLDTANREMNCNTEMLLYAAARAQLIAQVIKPAVAQGKAVICDRFVDSTYAYQGFGRGLDLRILADINRAAVDGLMPDATFFFDLSPEIALARRLRDSQADRIESENMDFHMRVYNGYLKLAYLYPERIRRVDSDRSIEEISVEVKGILDSIL